MKPILYIGNKLKNSITNETSIFSLGNLLEQEGYTMVYASEKERQLLRLWDMLFTTLKYHKQVGSVLIDTYSTHNFYYAFFVSQLCRFLGLKYIPILRGGNLPNRLQRSPSLSKCIFKYAHQNIAPSLYLKEAFEVKGYTNVIYIPNTIELVNYPFQTLQFDVPKLLWVRSFARLYNPQMAVRVLKALRDRGIDAQLSMVGPDSDGTLMEVKRLAKELNVKVIFTGKLTKAEWTNMAKDYNVFINTTNFDNTPVSIIEAMALGLPIVSTNVGGIPYLINHNTDGLLIPPDDVDAMVKAIIKIFEEPSKRERLINNARSKAESFDWGVVKRMWQEVIDDI